MSSLPFMVGTLCVFAIAYRYYSAFLAARVVRLDATRVTPAHIYADGANYDPTNKWVLFGHHFAAIAGAGPLIGPVLAAQFGFLPGFLWLLIGVVLAGAVQDFIILFASARRGGRSLVEITRQEISGRVATVTAVAVLFIIIIAMAGLGLAVVNALQNSAWGVFAIGSSIPLAVVMGVYMKHVRAGKIMEATLFGVAGLVAALAFGKTVAASSWGMPLALTRNETVGAMAAYGWLASVLPMWVLLVPRDYLSTYIKVGTIAVLIGGILWINPAIHQPMFSTFVHGGGPIIPGKVFPFVFITIACGAISGFHALVGSGTTPKMLNNEMDIRPIGYGAMLMEGLVGITALIACCALHPADYFAINSAPAKFAALGLTPIDLPHLSQQIGESVSARPGGAVSLAVGMAQVFSALPGMGRWMSYWYHFAILFEALFILTTIDAGTRVGRFVLQELMSQISPRFERIDSMPTALLSSSVIVGAWVYFLLTGNVSTIWPMFGIANQLLAVIALSVGTVVLIKMGQARYAWVTALPLVVVGTTTLSAAWLSILHNFLPLAHQPGEAFQGYLNCALTLGMMAGAIYILIACGKKAVDVLKSSSRIPPRYDHDPSRPLAGISQ